MRQWIFTNRGWIIRETMDIHDPTLYLCIFNESLLSGIFRCFKISYGWAWVVDNFVTHFLEISFWYTRGSQLATRGPIKTREMIPIRPTTTTKSEEKKYISARNSTLIYALIAPFMQTCMHCTLPVYGRYREFWILSTTPLIGLNNVVFVLLPS